MLIFAHNEVDHGNDLQTVAHNWPLLIVLSLVVITLMALAYWLLMRTPTPQERKEEER
jgi:uncharacterized membrane protein AbrB (regulator of aidB expression)